jgi:hypothetical protein
VSVAQAVLEVLAVQAELVELAAPVVSVDLAESEEPAEPEAEIEFQLFRPVEGTVVTGSISRNIGAALPIATGQLPIDLAGRRAVIHSPTVGIARGNNLAARVAMSVAIAAEVEAAWAIALAVEALGIGLVVEQTESAAAIFPAAGAAIAMPSEAAHVAMTARALAQIAAAVRPVWDLAVEAGEDSAAEAVAVAVVVGGAGNDLGQQRLAHRSGK